MIWWPWLLVTFLAGFVWAVYLAREEHQRQADKITRLLRELYDTRDELAKANRLLHGDIDKSDPDWWKR